MLNFSLGGHCPVPSCRYMLDQFSLHVRCHYRLSNRSCSLAYTYNLKVKYRDVIGKAIDEPRISNKMLLR